MRGTHLSVETKSLVMRDQTLCIERMYERNRISCDEICCKKLVNSLVVVAFLVSLLFIYLFFYLFIYLRGCYSHFNKKLN